MKVNYRVRDLTPLLSDRYLKTKRLSLINSLSLINKASQFCNCDNLYGWNVTIWHDGKRGIDHGKERES